MTPQTVASEYMLAVDRASKLLSCCLFQNSHWRCHQTTFQSQLPTKTIHRCWCTAPLQSLLPHHAASNSAQLLFIPALGSSLSPPLHPHATLQLQRFSWRSTSLPEHVHGLSISNKILHRGRCQHAASDSTFMTWSCIFKPVYTARCTHNSPLPTRDVHHFQYFTVPLPFLQESSGILRNPQEWDRDRTEIQWNECTFKCMDITTCTLCTLWLEEYQHFLLTFMC